MFSLADAEYFYSKRTKKVMHRKNYEKLLEQKTKSVQSYDGIVAVQTKMGFNFCYKDSKGVFTNPDGTIIEGLTEEIL